MTTFDAPPVTVSSATDQPAEWTDNALTARVPALRPLSPVPTYIGIAVAVIGFVAIAIAWGKVAGETNVGLQMPFLISGGISGLALVVVGMTIVNVAAKRRDALLREQQTRLLADAVHELSAALDRR